MTQDPCSSYLFVCLFTWVCRSVWSGSTFSEVCGVRGDTTATLRLTFAAIVIDVSLTYVSACHILTFFRNPNGLCCATEGC